MTWRRLPLWLGLCASAGLLPAQQEGVIAGVVQNGWTAAPVQRAAVTLATGTAEPLEALTYTDSRGAFAFTGVPGGRYFLHADLPGYQRAAYGRVNLDQPPVPLFLRAGEIRQNIILKMLPLGSLSGTVTDSDGDGVPHAEVHLLHANYDRGKLRWVSFGQAMTDDHGAYRLAFVRPGKYRILAMREGQPVSGNQSDVTNGQPPLEQTLGVQYYSNAESVDSAITLTLAAGNELKGIDFSLPLVSRVRLNGSVTMPPGVGPEAFVTIQLTAAGPVTRLQQWGAGAGPPDYHFQFENVLPGSYLATATLEANEQHYRAVQRVEAGADQSISLTLIPGSPLSGKLFLEGQGVRNSGPYQVELTPGDDTPFSANAPKADVKPDGTFQFDDVLPGVWDIGVKPMPKGSYLKSMLLGNQDVLTEEMPLGAGRRDEMKIVLSGDGGVVSGTVTTAQPSEPSDPSAPKAASIATAHRVVLLAPAGKFSDVLSFYEQAASDNTGHFEFKSVTPGAYRLVAFDAMEGGEWRDPDFLKPYLDKVKVFNVPEGARVTQDAVLFVRGVEP